MSVPLLVAGCKGRRHELVGTANAASAQPSSPSPAPTPTPTTPTPAPAPSPPACPSADAAKIAPFEIDRSQIKAAVPQIEDPKGSLKPFYDRLLTLARGQAKDHLRIGFYGDSNLTQDHITGHIRRELQHRFGDAGHGFVALARPWAWYNHEDVHHHGTWPLWKQMAPTTDPVWGHRYGFAHIAAESRTGGAAAWVGTADATAPVGKSASTFDVYFLKQPKGGSFDLVLDGTVLRTVSTAADDFEAGYDLVETSDGPHQLRAVVKGDGIVRLYGATLERAASSSASSSSSSPSSSSPSSPSIVVDSLGTGAMNFQRFMLTEPKIRKEQLEHRHYDLVIVWMGMNAAWLEPNRAWARDTVTTLRDALGGGADAVPVLLLSPADTVKPGEGRSEPRIVQLVKQLREIAKETGIAFWDFRAAMGGDASFLEFMKRRLASPDRAHLLKSGSDLMGTRLLAAIFAEIGARLEASPEAGCIPDPRSQ
jgi:hypothetical protein